MFYVNGDTALDWEAQGFLLPLDDYIQNQGFDMSKFFPGYQDTFKGTDGKTYGIAKDGNTIAMAYNTGSRARRLRRRSTSSSRWPQA